MGVRDIKSNNEVGISFAQTSQTANVTGSSIDVSDFMGAAVLVDVASYTDGTHTIEVEESDDNSSWSAVADDDLDGTEPVIDASGDVGQHYLGYTGNKRYLRVNVSVSGVTSGAEYGAYIIKGFPKQIPAN